MTLQITSDKQREYKDPDEVAEALNKRYELEQKRDALKQKSKPESPENETKQTEPTQITPIKVTEPEKYLILPGNSHGKYNYDNSLISVEKTLHNKNWFDCHKELLKQGYHMPTIPQFIDFLNLLKSGKAFHANGTKADTKLLERILDEILTVKSPWRSEWLDADFKVKGNDLYVNYSHTLDAKGNLLPKYSEKLTDYLTEDKTPGIDLNEWLKDANVHGLPKPNIKNGNLYYWAPDRDNNSVAGFLADSVRAALNCDRYPTYTYSDLGVRIITGEPKK